MLATIRRGLALGRDDRALVAEAAVQLWMMRLGLWILPFRWFYTPPPVAPVPGPAPDRIARAVARGARLVPSPTCLVRALAARRLLAHHGHASRLRLGVARPAEGRFEAHAWLECCGVTVVGGGESDLEYSTLESKRTGR